MPLGPLPAFDLYLELGVAPDADAAAIERAWRLRVRSAHPDRAGSEERAATEQTARLNVAREWLIDPVRRAQYDQLRRPGPRAVIPDIDPLGAWPARTRSRSSSWRTFVTQAPVLVALLIVAVTVIVGIGSNVVTIVAFDLSLVTLAWYGLYALVGVAYRWRNDRHGPPA